MALDEGRVVATESVSVDILRWSECSVEVSHCQHGDEVIDAVTASLSEACAEDGLDGRTLAMRLILTGATPAHTDLMNDPVRWINEIRRCGTDMGLGRAWVEKVVFKTHTPIDLGELAAREDALSELLRQMETLQNDEDALAALVGVELKPMIDRVNRDLGTTEETQRFSQPEELRTLLLEARDLLVTRFDLRGSQPMRFQNLQLRAFGPFTDVALDFSANPSAIQLIYGPNEAGKSQALRAVRGLLFGIPLNTPDSFLHDNQALTMARS